MLPFHGWRPTSSAAGRASSCSGTYTTAMAAPRCRVKASRSRADEPAAHHDPRPSAGGPPHATRCSYPLTSRSTATRCSRPSRGRSSTRGPSPAAASAPSTRTRFLPAQVGTSTASPPVGVNASQRWPGRTFVSASDDHVVCSRDVGRSRGPVPTSTSVRSTPDTAGPGGSSAWPGRAWKRSRVATKSPRTRRLARRCPGLTGEVYALRRRRGGGRDRLFDPPPTFGLSVCTAPALWIPLMATVAARSSAPVFLRARLASAVSLLPLGVWTVVHLWHSLAAFDRGRPPGSTPSRSTRTRWRSWSRSSLSSCRWPSTSCGVSPASARRARTTCATARLPTSATPCSA